ncbi:MAG: hypothetical protein U9N40_06860 [Euryarchaeota archaeon]|nr:hypothetical protein [Euryarchaeota archaeon]
MTKILYRSFIFIIALMILAGGAQALTITASPAHIMEGDEITVNIQGLRNGSSFTIHIGAEVDLEGDQNFLFSSNNLNVPFSLSDTTITVQAEPIVWTKFRYDPQDGGPIKSLQFGSDNHPVRNGIVSHEESFGSISSGSVLSLIEISGKALPDENSVLVSMELNGVKTGIDDSSISYSITGMSQGTANIIVYVDGSEALNEDILVGVVPTSVPPTSSPSGGNDGNSGSSVDPTATPAQDESLTFQSMDKVATLTAMNDTLQDAESGDIIIIKTSPLKVPDEWECLSGAYIVSPASLRFSEPAEFLVKGNSDLATYSPFIAGFADDTWTIIPSKIVDKSVVSKISEAGTYALMALKQTDGVTVTEAPVGITTDPSSTTSAIAERTEATAPATQSGLPAILSICGLFIAFVIGISYKKE